MDDWERLFGRVDASPTVAETSERLAAVRSETRTDDETTPPTDASDDGGDGSGGGDGDGGETDGRVEPSPARVVVDADVLAADLLGDEDARAALDELRRHSWTTLVASDALVADAAAVIASLTDESLATAWRDRVEAWREPVTHPAGDHPALASAYRGGAMHVLSFDDSLTGAGAGLGLADHFRVSVREPRAFATLFDPASLYAEVVGGEYPGPDTDPRG
ncbi:hypothetical protein RYH80_06625 [Halobaculum sp. MBLA0147]|uniref:DUF7384 family protein n=1 Tax=Halobaculum sp. MBLA0147 TaxID=3079934 RepID=UPI00352691D0